MADPTDDLTKDDVLKLFYKHFKADERRSELRKSLKLDDRRNLYEVARFLREGTKERLGAYLDDVHIYLQDPLVAEVIPQLGIETAEVRWEPGQSHGPTNARLAVVDYNADTAVLTPPARWNKGKRRFEGPDGQPLGPDQYELHQFHQVNAWAIVQRVIDMYEDPFALGRPIPWATGGNRLIIVPHAGYGENAFYDRSSKSLQFYSYGTEGKRKHTCLSHDIIAHETGHALLDGIRPYYYEFTSVQTAAFHEFIADLTAILAALRNNAIRRETARRTAGDLNRDNAIAALAEEFGEHVTGVRKLRDANNELTMDQIEGSVSPHYCSQVLTGAMFEILVSIAAAYMDQSHMENRVVTPGKALWWASQRLGRISLQPIDFCPSVDIQFIDYARAVLRNFEVFEPHDSPRWGLYLDSVRSVFHKRGLCPIPLEECRNNDYCECHLYTDQDHEDLKWDIYHDINRISRSRTAAYYFLNDNRKALHIPDNQDIVIVDLYDTNKYGRNALRLPREIVLQYMWREEFDLDGSKFGSMQGQTAELLCGGTLVLDGRGNVLSWFRKPGTELEKDRQEGMKRRQQLEDHLARLTADGMVGLRGETEVEVFGAWTPPVVADTRAGALRLQVTPHMRDVLYVDPTKPDLEAPEVDRVWDWREDEWTTSY
jgi:hypothetical protein